MRNFVKVTKAISDENRIRILMFLRDGELCLCQINEVLGLASSTVSKHMSILFEAGLVRVRKEGRWRYFRLPGKKAPRYIQRCVEWLDDSLKREKAVVTDAKKCRRILKIPVEEFCRSYRKK